MIDQPQYPHDCKTCRFHGCMRISYRVFDVYTCEHTKGDHTPTLIVLRYGNDGTDILNILLGERLPTPFKEARDFILTSEGKQPYKEP
jgi:hypothetical protein